MLYEQTVFEVITLECYCLTFTVIFAMRTFCVSCFAQVLYFVEGKGFILRGEEMLYIWCLLYLVFAACRNVEVKCMMGETPDVVVTF